MATNKYPGKVPRVTTFSCPDDDDDSEVPLEPVPPLPSTPTEQELAAAEAAASEDDEASTPTMEGLAEVAVAALAEEEEEVVASDDSTYCAEAAAASDEEGSDDNNSDNNNNNKKKKKKKKKKTKPTKEELYQTRKAEAEEFGDKMFRPNQPKLSDAVQIAMKCLCHWQNGKRANNLLTRRNKALEAYLFSPSIIDNDISKMKLKDEDRVALMWIYGTDDYGKLDQWFYNVRRNAAYKKRLETIKKKANEKGQHIKYFRACELGLDPSQWEDLMKPVDVDWVSIEKKEGTPDLESAHSYKTPEGYLQIEERKPSKTLSVQTRKTMQRKHTANYNGVGEAENTIAIQNDVYWKEEGNTTKFLYDCCQKILKDGNDPPPTDWTFEVKFLQVTNSSGPWNGAWIKNIAGFAIFQGYSNGVYELVNDLRVAGWRFAMSSIRKIGKTSTKMKWTDRDLEVFLFHPLFYPGVPDDVLKKINKGFIHNNNKLKKAAEQKKNLLEHLRKEVLVVVAKSNIHGVGVRALTEIGRGKRLFKSCNEDADPSETIELTDDEISTLPNHVQILIKKFILRSSGGYYPVPIGGLTDKTGVSMYMNSSSGTGRKANVKPVMNQNDGTGFAMMKTTRKIRKGEELLYKYKYDNDCGEDYDDDEEEEKGRKDTDEDDGDNDCGEDYNDNDYGEDDDDDEEEDEDNDEDEEEDEKNDDDEEEDEDDDDDDEEEDEEDEDDDNDDEEDDCKEDASRKSKKPTRGAVERSTAKKRKHNNNKEDDKDNDEKKTTKQKKPRKQTRQAPPKLPLHNNRRNDDASKQKKPTNQATDKKRVRNDHQGGLVDSYKPGCFTGKAALFYMEEDQKWEKGRVREYYTKEQRIENGEDGRKITGGMYRYTLDCQGSDGDVDYFSDEDKTIEIEGKQGDALWKRGSR